MRRSFLVAIWLLGAGVGLSCNGCSPSPDVSGWELVPKQGVVLNMEVYPDIPVTLLVTLPATSSVSSRYKSTRPIYSTYLRQLDEGSVFRRGYSAPTP
jgi:hypothetical protein